MSPSPVEKLQLLQQNLQALLMKKQNSENQLSEVDSALSNLNDGSYKIIGNLMLKVDAQTIKQELIERKKNLELRLKTLAGHEQKLKESLEKAQQEFVKNTQQAKN